MNTKELLGAMQKSLIALLILIACSLAISFVSPLQSASALEVTSITAAPNSEDGREILGSVPTRMSLRASADNQEEITSITIRVPEVALDREMAKTTVLDGVKRLDISAEVISLDKNTLQFNFDTPVPPTSNFLLEIYEVAFPGDGGAIPVQFSYETIQGSKDFTEYEKPIQVTPVSLSQQIASWLNSQGWVQAWNSNTFLNLFLNPAIFVTSAPVVFKGWLTALAIVVLAFPAAIPIGFLLALMRMSKIWLVKVLASTYVNIIRGTPMFLQIYIAFFGLPLLGLQVDNFVLGCFVMAFNSSAYLCEIFRAGIQSIQKGQFEAARSLGMNSAQTMIFIIVPQAVKRVIPTMTNELILLYKDTSLLASVGIMESVMYAKTITAATGNITPYIVAAGFYLIVTLPMSRITRKMEESTFAKSAKRKAQRKKEDTNDDSDDDDDTTHHNKKGSWQPTVDHEKDVLAIKTADL